MTIPREFTLQVVFVKRPMQGSEFLDPVADRADLLPFLLVEVFKRVKSGILGNGQLSLLHLDEVFVRRVLGHWGSLLVQLGQRWSLELGTGE